MQTSVMPIARFTFSSGFRSLKSKSAAPSIKWIRIFKKSSLLRSTS
jgi:hypothetical protein